MYLSSNLTYLRKSKKTSQSELADLLGVTNSAISGYEKGRNTPTFNNFLRLADFFKVNLHDFVYKDLSTGSYTPVVRDQVAESEAAYGERDQLLKLCLRRIRELERFVREVAPEHAHEVGVDV